VIFRIVKDKTNPYVIINKTFLNDKNLSLKAKGLLSYLLSMPDDWKVYETEITQHSSDGIRSTRGAIKELMDSGYINRYQKKDDKNRFAGYEYCVYEIPPVITKCDNGKCDNAKQHTTNNNLTDNDLTEYKKEKGVLSKDENTHSSPYTNEDAVKAMKTYMNDLYRQKTGKKHPLLKPEQYRNVYDSISGNMGEWGTGYQAMVDMMCAFFNNKTIQSDWNINHFATEGIMLNRMYEVAY
jgi:hypothetical protein